MEKNISQVLKEATKDILTEDVLNEIQAAFDASVNEKVALHVEKALTEQDEDYSKKLETLLEAIDADHTAKLNKVVNALDRDRANKLRMVVEKYEAALTAEASNFKSTLVEQVSNYLDLYLEEKVPTVAIEEAVNNKRAISVLADIRKMLSVDMALAQESIREAVVDGKSRIDEAAEQLEVANKRVSSLTEELNKVKSALVLEQKISSLDEEKQKYMKKMLGNKSAKFIAENFNYTLGLFEKTEEERLTGLKNEAITETVASTVDRPVIEESINTSTKTNSDAPLFNVYMSELGKY